MAEARGFYAKAERNIPASGSFTWATSWPVVFVAISGEAGGHCTVIDWHTERLARVSLGLEAQGFTPRFDKYIVSQYY
jgi:hypothetical protein